MKLPLDCEVTYCEHFLSQTEADEIYRLLLETYRIDQHRLTIMAGGKIIETDSFKFFFATPEMLKKNSHPEHIHGTCFPWTGAMESLRTKVEKEVKKKFDLAMCLYYPDGKFYAPYHSDQPTSGVDTILPSLSFGAVREFSFRHKENEQAYNLKLAHGSLLAMGKYCQHRYEHSLLKDPNCQAGRINITFRDANYK